MDNLNELRNSNISVKIGEANQEANQNAAENEEEKRRRLLDEEREARVRQEAFAVDDEFVVKKRFSLMSNRITYDAASKRVDEMLKIIQNIFKDSTNYMFVTNREMANRVLGILKIYEVEVSRIGVDDARIATIEAYKEKCRNSLDKTKLKRETIERDENIDMFADSLMKDNEEEESESLNASVDNTLSAEAMEGVHRIDRWMLRHMHETGMTENDKFAFVSKLLMLPARERLYMYYIIEKGHRHKPMMSDVVESQLSYVPDKDEFVSKMKMSKLRVFRRAANGSIYWGKLSDAYGQLEYVRPSIEKYSKIDQNATVKNGERNDSIVNAYVRANGGDRNPETERKIKQAVELRNSLLKQRDKALKGFRDALVVYGNKKKIADRAWVNKNKKKDAALAAAAEAHAKLQVLIAKDSAVGVIEQQLRTGNADILTEHVKAEGEAIEEEGFSQIDNLADAHDNVSYHLGYTINTAHDTIADIANEALDADRQFLGISNTHLAHMSVANFTTLSVLAIGGAISTLSALVDFSSKSSDMMTGDWSAAMVDLASKVAFFFESVYTAVNSGIDTVDAFSTVASAAAETAEKITDAAEEAVDAAGKTLTTAEAIAKYVGIGTASLSLVANTGLMLNSMANSSYTTKSERFLAEKRRAEENRRELYGEERAEEKKRLRKEKYEDNLLKHQRRVLKSEKTGIAVNLLSSAALLGSTFTGGLLSPVFSSISIGLGIYSTIRDSIAGRRLKKQSVDDFLGIAGYDSELLQNAFMNHLENSKIRPSGEMVRDKFNSMSASEQKSYKKKTIDQLRTAIRNEIMAKMGCATKEAMFNKIMEKYAEVIYAGAFMNGDAEINDVNALESADRLPYVNFIKSLGLKIKITDDGIRPTKEAIVTKLQG